MRREDYIGPPCRCGECVQAGVSEQEQRRDPRTGAWLHGHDLRRWLEARDTFLRRARAAVGPKGRHAAGFEPLARKEPTP